MVTGDLYRSAVHHSVVSLQHAIQHVTRLSSTRTTKLRDTLSAILEFESGMQSLNQWLRDTERSLIVTPSDWKKSSIASRYAMDSL